MIDINFFNSTLLGGGEGVMEKSILCTLVKMLKIMDDPLPNTVSNFKLKGHATMIFKLFCQ